ncbi:MAG: hypothetical protein HY748_04875 [Elusimicrobia bacterium]|nr:hypothetical protein [Elusimicrobiota bacterium]
MRYSLLLPLALLCHGGTADAALVRATSYQLNVSAFSGVPAAPALSAVPRLSHSFTPALNPSFTAAPAAPLLEPLSGFLPGIEFAAPALPSAAPDIIPAGLDAAVPPGDGLTDAGGPLLA